MALPSAARPRYATLKQVVVEFPAQNTVTDRVVILSSQHHPAEHPYAEAVYGLQRTSQGVVTKVYVGQFDNLRCDPTGADLIAGKAAFIRH